MQAEKAYHRFWVDGRALSKPAADEDDPPLWAKALALLIAAALYCGLVIGVAYIVLHVWIQVQTRHVDWCVDMGGKMSVGALFYVSCYDLTPNKSDAPPVR